MSGTTAPGPGWAARGLRDVVDAVVVGRKATVFLGAGVSAAAGIPVASQIVSELGELIRSRDSTSRGGSPKDVLAWLRDQPFFDADDAYATVLDACFASPVERGAYFDRLIGEAEPTATHLAIAEMMERGLISTVVTTNFDRLMEYAIVRACGVMPSVLLFDVDPEYTNMRTRRPSVFKLHGDYLYGNIRNLGHEVHLVKESTKRKIELTAEGGPLIVAGYSGGDASVMDVLEEVAADDSSFREGVYWLSLRGHRVPDRVLELLGASRGRGSLVEIDSSDAFFMQLLRELPKSREGGLPRLRADAHRVSVQEHDREPTLRQRLDSADALECSTLLLRRTVVRDLSTSPAALDYLAARFEEEGDIPWNVGEMVDRFVDLLVGGTEAATSRGGARLDDESRADRRLADLKNLGLLPGSEEENSQVERSVFRDYIRAVRWLENGLEPKQLGEVIADEQAYGALCLYVGLVNDATSVISSALQQSVDAWILHGRRQPWPENFCRAAALVGYGSAVDKALIERITDMLLMEFDTERWLPEAAIRALSSMGAGVVDHLLAYMLDSLQDTFSREDAALALGEMGTRRVVEKLAEAGQRVTSRDAKMVVYALGLTRNHRAAAKLQELAPKVAKVSEWVLLGALKRVGYDGTDVSAGADAEDPSPRPALDALATLHEYCPGLGNRPDTAALLGAYLQNPSGFVEAMDRLGWPPDVRDLSRVGIGLLAEDKAWEAEILLAECLDRYPMVAQNYHNLALAYSRQNRPSAARRYYALGLSLDPDRCDYFNDFAVTMIKLDNLEAARHLLTEAIAKEPTNHRPWFNLANVNLRESGAFDDAASDRTTVTPGLDVERRRVRLSEETDAGRLHDARTCLHQVLTLNPAHPTARDVLEGVYDVIGRGGHDTPDARELAAALHLGQTVIPGAARSGGLSVEVVDAWRRSGECNARGDFPGALAAMEEARRLGGESPDIDHNISVLYADLGDVMRAIEIQRSALLKWPWDLDLLLNHSGYLRQTGNEEDALKVAQKAIQVAPSYAPCWYALGEALYSLDKIDDAIEAFRQTIRFARDWSTITDRARKRLLDIERRN